MTGFLRSHSSEERKPIVYPLDLLEKKRDGRALSEEEIRTLIHDYSRDRIPDYQMSAFLMATFLQGMTPEETAALTQAMLDSGRRVNFDRLPRIPVDKHSTGGVGDKITLPLVPLVMAYEVPVPMLSGRGLGHSGGTLDKLESIPGFRVDLALEDYQRQVETLGAVIMGQTAELAPADKKIYALRDVTATVPSIPLITASILSKKVAGGARGLVLDVKTGSGAFMQTRREASALAHSLVRVGTQLGLKISGYITNMDQPLGRTVGTALEVRETIEILQGRGPEDTTELTVVLGGDMLLLGQQAASVEEGRAKIRQAIEDGRGLVQLRRLIEAQDGDASIVDDPNRLPGAPETKDVAASASGWVQKIDARQIGLATIQLGGGRLKVEDRVDHRVGLEMLKKVGQRVQPKEPLVRLHVSENSRVTEAEEIIRQAYQIGSVAPQPDPLVWERISEE